VIKKYILFIILILLFTCSENTYAQFNNLEKGSLGYIRPLPIIPMISGSLGEYRPTHLHSGIDYRTFAVNNIPVLATKDAWVHRLLGTRAGFGKAIYLKHHNQTMSIYGHLNYLSDKFSLEAGWQLMKLMSDRSWFSIYLPRKKFEFSQGQQVAYSGERGSGPSHLHYELRDSKYRSLNFLSRQYNSVQDTKSPLVQKIYVFTKKFQMTKRKKSSQDCSVKLNSKYKSKSAYKEYKCKKIIDVNGLTALKFSSYDYTNNSANKMGVYSIELTVDSKRLYYVIFDKIKHAGYYYTYQYYDRHKTQLRPYVRYTYRAYWPVNDIKKKYKTPDNLYFHKNYGYIDTSDWKPNSQHRAKIRIKDANQNSSDIIIYLRKAKGKEIKADVSHTKIYNNLRHYKQYSKYLGSLKVFTNRLKKDAFLSLRKKYKRKRNLGGSIRRVSNGIQIIWKRRNRHNHLYFHWKTKYQTGKGVFNSYGRLISSQYNKRYKAYVGSLAQSTTLYLGKDYYAPNYRQSFLYGSLEQEMVYLKVSDKGSGLNQYKFDAYIDGVKLNSRQKQIWNVHYDRDRRGFVFPTGFRSNKDEFQKGKLHLLWFRAFDKTNNPGHLWQGYINLK